MIVVTYMHRNRHVEEALFGGSWVAVSLTTMNPPCRAIVSRVTSMVTILVTLFGVLVTLPVLCLPMNHEPPSMYDVVTSECQQRRIAIEDAAGQHRESLNPKPLPASCECESRTPKPLNPKPYTGATERGQRTKISTLNSCLDMFPRPTRKEPQDHLRETGSKEGLSTPTL